MFGKIVGLAACLVATMASVAYAEQRPTLATVVEAYNGLPSAGTPLALETGTTSIEPVWQPASATLPSWLTMVELSESEAEALVAAVGAYGVDQEYYRRPKRRASFSDVMRMVATTTVAIALYNVADNSGRQGDHYYPYDVRRRDIDSPGNTGNTKATWRWSNREDRFASLLVEQGACVGAFVSALAKLQSVKPDHAFTAFVKSVHTASVAPGLALDPSCSAT